MAQTAEKITVLGLGQCGVRVVSTLSRLDAARSLRLLAFDTDARSIADCPLPDENKLLLGFERMRQGCGGSVSAGNSAFGRNRSDISRFVSGSQSLIVVGGLGGGTATGGLPVVADYAKDIPCLFLLSLPFSWEGQSRMRTAEKALVDELLPRTNVSCITVPNDLLFSRLASDIPMRDGFELAQKELAHSVLALAAILASPELLSVNFATFRKLLHKRKSFAAIGIGRAGNSLPGASDRAMRALDEMLHSPLMGGVEKLQEADAAIFALLGGADLSLGESRQALDAAVKTLSTEARTIVCAGRCDDLGQDVLMACFAIKFDVSEEELAKFKARQNRRHSPGGAAPAGVQQLTLEFESSGRGIMEGTRRTIENNEDLDMPTFRRRQLSVDTGMDT